MNTLSTSVEMKKALWFPEAADHLVPNGDHAPPAGSWTRTYAELVHHPSLKGRRIRCKGSLHLQRVAGADGTFRLEGRRDSLSHRGGAFRMCFSAECREDELGTLVTWETRSVSLGADGREIPVSEVRQHGAADGDRSDIGGRLALRRPDVPLTADICLLEAVQRLSRLAQPVRFDMLESFITYKSNQELRHDGPVDLVLNGRSLCLNGFRQTGSGILPWHYWVDETKRLVFACGGLKAYALNPDPPAG